MNLNELKPAKGATHHQKRIGRGQGSGNLPKDIVNLYIRKARESFRTRTVEAV